MRAAVYGADGSAAISVGGFAQAGADVRFIAHGAHLRALREQGLRMRSVQSNFKLQTPATDYPAEVGS